MRPSQIVSSVLLCSPLVAAWPWSGDVVAQARDLILPHKRAPQEVTLGSDSAATPRPEDVITTNTAVSTLSDDAQQTDGPSTLASDDETSTLESDSGSATTTGTGRSSGTRSRTSGRSGSQTTETFDARLPAGGIAMITPNPTSLAQYYKIGDYVTFAWNYTSLSVTPSAIDVLASCSANQATYTIAVNQSISESTGAVTWDTKESATVAMLTGTYTLIIYDSDSSMSAVARAGYLAPYRQFTFGMYEKQPYVALEGQVCITCSGAGSIFEKQTMGFAMLMATITVLSFTCFARGAGVLA